jgi:hypothetical protein
MRCVEGGYRGQALRRKRTRLLPLERRIIAVKYRDRVPVKVIMAEHNCVLTTVLSAARYEGMAVPRPRTLKCSMFSKSPVL